ncbi:MAG: peroxiredoxin [Bdellovibrionales bacterium]|nr:peroxiredoxin [Bdellovibrionales bacterium]
MSETLVGQSAPDLALETTGGRTVNLSQLKGQSLIVYFYPKDNTPGCTQEGRDFTALHKQVQAGGGEIFGVSKDSLKSHENFKSKQKYTFDLISDPDGKLCHAFDVIKEKSFMGKSYIGIDRSTFVIDKSGTIVKEWRSVKVKGHAQEVLDFLKTL